MKGALVKLKAGCSSDQEFISAAKTYLSFIGIRVWPPGLVACGLGLGAYGLGLGACGLGLGARGLGLGIHVSGLWEP